MVVVVESRLALDETVPLLALAVAVVVESALRLTAPLICDDADTRLLRLVHSVKDDVGDSPGVACVETVVPTVMESLLEAVCVEETAADWDDDAVCVDDDDGASLTEPVTVKPEREKAAVIDIVIEGGGEDVPRALAELRAVGTDDSVAASDVDADCERRTVGLITVLDDADPDERRDPDSDAVVDIDAVIDSHARGLFDVSGDFDDEAVMVTESDCAVALEDGL